MTAREIQSKLRSLGTPEAAARRCFKTGPGQYGEGDIFLGIRTPVLRAVASEYRGLAETETLVLLGSEVHEHRMLALLIFVRNAINGDEAAKRRIYDLYLAHTRFINNWDLVDASARDIVGGYLCDRNRKPLDRLARSKSVWERRIAIVATHFFIARHDFADTLRIAERLLSDRHDLIHKATGWMLREVGERDQPTLENFLQTHHQAIPRTGASLCHRTIPEEQRREYLRKG